MRQWIVAVILLGLFSGCATTEVANNTPPESPAVETINLSKVLAQAEQAYEQGDLQAAEKAYRLAIKHSPHNAMAQYQLGNTLVRQNRFDDAIKAYKASLEQDNKNTKTYNNLATLYMVQAQSVLASGIENLPEAEGDTAQIKYMLWQLKKITPDKMQDLEVQQK